MQPTVLRHLADAVDTGLTAACKLAGKVLKGLCQWL